MKAIAFAQLIGLLLVFAAPAHADIFQWEYINPADPSQGKQQSTTLAPDGAGVDAVPGANLSERNLTMAYLIGADLTGANGYSANLTDADMSQANLSYAHFGGAYLTGANLTGGDIRGANFGRFPGCSSCGTGITLAQLYSTASYQANDLNGIDLTYNELSGGNFAGQNLTNATLRGATLTGADFTGAEVRGAGLGPLVNPFNGYTYGTEITLDQLYSTASYQAHDLNGIRLSYNDLTGGNFAGQNLTNASFVGATLSGADFTGAEVRGAGFGLSFILFVGGFGTGITLDQLYSTASYQAHDLNGVGLGFNDLTGGNFAGQNLTTSSFVGASLTGADFTDAEVRGANLGRTGIMLAQLYSTASYQTHDLTAIHLDGNDLSGGSFAGQNLTNASFGDATLTGAIFREANLTNAYLFAATLTGADFSQANLTNAFSNTATLTGADFTSADTRGALYLDLSGATTTNLIAPNGHIDGLDLVAGGLLVVRDYDGDARDPYLPPKPPIPITVVQHFVLGPGGTLRMVFEADAWDSTISFAAGIPVTLGGTLELTFAANVNLASQVGRTFDLFNWTGVHPSGTFNVSSPYAWDLSNLYTTGDVTLTAIPEPSTLVLFMFAVIAGAYGNGRTDGKFQKLIDA